MACLLAGREQAGDGRGVAIEHLRVGIDVQAPMV